jgi:hypothetical protein
VRNVALLLGLALKCSQPSWGRAWRQCRKALTGAFSPYLSTAWVVSLTHAGELSLGLVGESSKTFSSAFN